MRHIRFEEVKTLIKHNIAVMTTGGKGSGKTTMITQVAEDLDLELVVMSMTRQTTLSNLLGFRNIEGTYIPTLIRHACEFGGLLLLDEADASDPNVLLCLNTIENGFISFPDKIVQCHPDFRLAATANPQTSEYTGRAKLDAATLDRFDIVPVDTDPALEESLVGKAIAKEMTILRKVLKNTGSSTDISMRDSLRYSSRKKLNLHHSFIERLLGDNPTAAQLFHEEMAKVPESASQAECKTSEELWKLLITEEKNNDDPIPF